MYEGNKLNEIVSRGRDAFSALVEKARPYSEKILALPNDSFQKTVVVALALCIVCAILVYGSAVALKSIQQNNKSLDMKKNILSVVGLLEDDTDIDAVFKTVEQKLVDLKTGEYVNSIDSATYDQRKAAKDPSTNIDIVPADDLASIRKRAKYTKVYLLKDGNNIKAIVLPVHGYGLWSTMYGFLALEADAQTVIGLNFYDQAETPGLGGEVVNPNWRALWKGKKVYDESGSPVLKLVKGVVEPNKPGSEYQVDGLAGATLTSNGVSNLLQYWLGDQGFALYLEKIRSNRG